MPIVQEHPTLYVGIDPGGSGGIATISGGNIVATSMPDTMRDLWNYFDGIDLNGHRRVFAVIEKVSGYIGENQPGSSAFKFGQSYGSLLMLLTAAGVPFEEVTPQRWQKYMEIPKRKPEESKTVWKNRLKAKAQQLFPSEKVTLATADALLIADYCRRIRHERGD